MQPFLLCLHSAGPMTNLLLYAARTNILHTPFPLGKHTDQPPLEAVLIIICLNTLRYWNWFAERWNNLKNSHTFTSNKVWNIVLGPTSVFFAIAVSTYSSCVTFSRMPSSMKSVMIAPTIFSLFHNSAWHTLMSYPLPLDYVEFWQILISNGGGR